MATKKSAESAPKSSGADTPDPMGDLKKAFEQFKLPGVDMQALIDGRRQDIEAVTAANKRAFDGMKSLAERQAEMLRESAKEFQDAIKELQGLSASDRASRTAELGREALQKTLTNMKELAETSVKSQTDAWNIVNDRFKENLAEMKQAFQRKG